MAKQSNRPTATNYQDYVLDYSNVDLSRYRGQADASPEAHTAQAEAGTWDKVLHSAAAIGEGLTMLPGGFVDTVRDAWRGGDIDVTDAEAQREREERAREQAAYVEKYRGKAFDGVADAMVSMPYSLATMGASLGAGIPVGIAAGPWAGRAAGVAASGTVAYRASRQNFMETMLDETTKLLGRRPSQAEWDAIAREFDNEAMWYAGFEAGPEALSNLIMGKLLGPLGKRFFSGGVGAAAKRVAGLYGEEFATETITQMGQGSIEADLGLRDSAPGVLQALGEIAPATFWQTTLMAGGKKGLDVLARRRAAQRDERQTETDAVAGEEQELPAAAPSPTPETDGRTAEPTTAEADGGMPDGGPVAEAAAGEAPARVAPETGRMEQGEHVDLLREDGGPLATAEDAAGQAARGKSAGEALPPVEGADSLPVRAGVPDLPSVPGGLTEAVPVPEAGGMPQEPERALPLPVRMRTTDATQGVPPAGREGQAGMGQAVVPERPAPLVPPQDMRPGELSAGMRPMMPEAATPAMPDILPQPGPDAMPQAGPEVGQGTAVPPQAVADSFATAPAAMPAPSAVAQPGPDVSQLGRGELLRLLPEEQRAAARRMTTPRIRELVRQAAAEKAAAVTPEASPLAPRAAESAVPQGQAQPDDPSGQRSVDRPVTAFDSEQPIPLPHVDGETPPKAEREAHLAQTAGAMNGLRTTAVHAHADERYLPSSDSGVSVKNISFPTAEVKAAEAGAALSAAQPGPEERHMADRSGEAHEGHDGLTRIVAHVPAGVIRKDEHRSAIAAAKDWLREHVSGPVQTRIGIVEVDANAVQDSLSHSIYQNKLDAVQAIVPVLEQGDYLGTLPDKDDKPIENHYFAGKVRIGERESIVFVRTRKAEGMPNRFYVHEVFTQEEIEKSEGIRGVTSDADRPFRNSSDFYRRILAEYLKVKHAGGKDTTAAQKTSPADAGHGPVPEARPDGERHLLPPHAESAGKGVAVPAHATGATGEKAPSGQRPRRTSGEDVPQDGYDDAYAARGGDAQNSVGPHEGRRGREEGLSGQIVN